MLCGVVGLCVVFAALGFRLNLTPSLPLGLYRLAPGPIERGALVATCLPLEMALEGRQRGYLSRGGCPGGASPVLKRVGAAREHMERYITDHRLGHAIDRILSSSDTATRV